MKQILTALLILTTTAAAFAAPSEDDYRDAWARRMNAIYTERILIDGTRCDVVLSGHAVEVDFAHKWAEAVGQSLHYARLLNLKPGILLIIESPNDIHNLVRLANLINENRLPITLWITTPSDLSKSEIKNQKSKMEVTP